MPINPILLILVFLLDWLIDCSLCGIISHFRMTLPLNDKCNAGGILEGFLRDSCGIQGPELRFAICQLWLIDWRSAVASMLAFPSLSVSVCLSVCLSFCLSFSLWRKWDACEVGQQLVQVLVLTLNATLAVTEEGPFPMPIIPVNNNHQQRKTRITQTKTNTHTHPHTHTNK